ncbi:uncharacterized protein LOC119185270 isoform X4 [Rhipicephalus microplus]|uniref:uncharacterized protein LOC119185270 isoform X4 n=1 Tax=Rhipicephalus microplus TaxID=6941 RepID=UPI003F6CB361
MYTATSTYAVIRVWGSTRAQPPFPFHGSAKACLLEHPHGRRSRFPSLSSRGTDFSPSAKKGILVRERATRAGNKTGVRTAARPLLHQPGTKEVGPANPPCEPRTTTTKGACSERSGTARTGTRMAVMEDIRGPDLRHATADLDPESFTWLKELSYKENLTSLNLDLSSMFAERYCFNEPVDEKKLGDLEKSAVKAAGLELVACHTYSSVWTFSSADACLDAYIPFFKLDSRVPEEKRAHFRDTWRRGLREASISKDGAISLVYDVIVVHSQKPSTSTPHAQ